MNYKIFNELYQKYRGKEFPPSAAYKLALSDYNYGLQTIDYEIFDL